MLRTITVLGLSSLLAVFLLYRANSDIVQNLSPQGCRMSWMSPSYLPQAEFDHTWSPLASRYSLWLYREVGWDSVQVCLFHGSFSVSVVINGICSNQATEGIACLSFSFRVMLDRPTKFVQSLRPRPDNIIRHLTLYRQLSRGVN
jgi:hypothetical protein